jgi:hypothetical protein
MSIQDEPHFELPASALANWIERQGVDRWWSVDGEPFLTRLMPFPCPGDELAAELRRIDRPLLVFDKSRNPEARGQVIGEDKLDELVDRLGDDVTTANRLLYLSWKGSDEPWLLVEDRETTESTRAETAAQGEKR